MHFSKLSPAGLCDPLTSKLSCKILEKGLEFLVDRSDVELSYLLLQEWYVQRVDPYLEGRGNTLYKGILVGSIYSLINKLARC